MSTFDEAFALANELHWKDRRKGTNIPYVSHLLAVASLVLEDGQTEAVAAGALLHDAAEDAGGLATVDRIGALLGAEVAGYVVECSDSLEADPSAKAPWKQRKQQAIEGVASHSTGALHIIAADKLHNVRAMLADLELEGDELWDRFNADRAEILWYHESMAAALQQRIPESRSVRLLHGANADLRRAVDGSVDG